MNVTLSIQERLEDLRRERGLTLEQLAEKVGLSRSALGHYENDDYRDISSYALEKLARFYDVSLEYLLGLTEQRKRPITDIEALHLSDEAIAVLKDAKFNRRLLSEIICHKDFQRLMIDSEIFVDRIADMRIHDMNVLLEAYRQKILAGHNAAAPDDLYMRTLELAQIQENDYFAHVFSEDLTVILKDIREAHKKDKTTADTDSPALDAIAGLEDVLSFEGSDAEKRTRIALKQIGIDYDSLTTEEVVGFMNVLAKSPMFKLQTSQRGKSQLSHGKGKRKKK